MDEVDIIESIQDIFYRSRVKWRLHCQQRMSERGISRQDVKAVIKSGEVICEYTDDKPYPSYLVMGKTGSRIIHALIAVDQVGGCCFVVTVYEPDLDHFDTDLKTRIKGK